MGWRRRLSSGAQGLVPCLHGLPRPAPLGWHICRGRTVAEVVSGGYVCWGLLTGWAAFGGAREALTGSRLVLGCCGGIWVQLEVPATAVGLWAEGGSGGLVQIRGCMYSCAQYSPHTVVTPGGPASPACAWCAIFASCFVQSPHAHGATWQHERGRCSRAGAAGCRSSLPMVQLPHNGLHDVWQASMGYFL